MRLIDADAAIEAVVGCTNCGTEDGLRAYVTKHSLENGRTGGIVDALDAIEQLPSAQPYTIHSDGRLWVTVDDIDKVNAVVVDESKSKFCKQFYMDAQPERKTGRWIPDNTDYYRTRFICSVCGESEEVPTTGFGYGAMWDYCPMCGAKMERRQDGH